MKSKLTPAALLGAIGGIVFFTALVHNSIPFIGIGVFLLMLAVFDCKD